MSRAAPAKGLREHQTVNPILGYLMDAGAVASLAAASVTLLAAQAVTANRAVVLAIAVAWILVWCVCVGEPIVRFWLVARRLPAVQGWRLHSLSLGFGGLVLVLLLAISIG